MCLSLSRPLTSIYVWSFVPTTCCVTYPYTTFRSWIFRGGQIDDDNRQAPLSVLGMWPPAEYRASLETHPPSVQEIREQISGDLWNRPEPITHAPRDSASATEQVGLFRVTADAMAHRPLQEDLARTQLNCHATWTSRMRRSRPDIAENVLRSS